MTPVCKTCIQYTVMLLGIQGYIMLVWRANVHLIIITLKLKKKICNVLSEIALRIENIGNIN